MNLVPRIANLYGRVGWMSGFTGGRWSAFRFWRAASRDPRHLGRGRYRGGDLFFRGLDTMALKEVLVDGEYEGVVRDLLAVAPAPVVLDVGAHIGLFALSVLRAAPGARVLSVEADPATFAVLARNVAAFSGGPGAGSVGGPEGGSGRWRVLNAAAWDGDGLELSFDDSGPSMSHRVSAAGSAIVRTISLASLVRAAMETAPAIDLLKVDVEGSEEAFLCAAPDALRHVRSLVVELHPALCDAARVRAVLSARYRTVEEIQERASAKPLLFCR